MDSSRGELPVSERWKREGDGDHYATDRWRNARASGRDPRLVQRLLTRYLSGNDTRLSSVLDAPCGAGRLRGSLEARGLEWTGLDVSPRMLTAAAAQHGSGKAGLACGSAFALPFRDRSFDLVVCCRLLHHLPESSDRIAVLSELVRVSRGPVIASYWDAGTYQAWRRRTQGPLRRKKGPETRHSVSWMTLRGELERARARPLGRAHSLKLVSQQTFFLAERLD